MIIIIDQIKADLLKAQQILEAFISNPNTFETLENAGQLMIRAIKSGCKIISCGNGGSLCDAMHFAEELTGRFRNDRMAFPAIAISDASHITCVANDYGLDFIYSRMVEGLGKPGDILLAISTSGNSKNVVNAISAAKSRGMQVIGLIGKNGGLMGGLCDVEIRVPHNGFSDRIQEIHMLVIHSLVNYIELSIKENS